MAGMSRDEAGEFLQDLDKSNLKCDAATGTLTLGDKCSKNNVTKYKEPAQQFVVLFGGKIAQ